MKGVDNMEFQSKKILEQFKVKEERSYNFLMRGVDIMKTLLNRNFDSFIIGSSVRNLYLCKPIDTIEIITTATPKEIKEIFPALIVERNGFSYLKEHGRYVVFTNFSNEETVLGKKLVTKHYNKKLDNTCYLYLKKLKMVKAIYLLFLRHPEGINFNYLPDYREELTEIRANI